MMPFDFTIQKRNNKDIGELNRLIKFQRSVRVDMGDGGYDEGWTDYKTVHAKKMDRRGNIELNINEHTENRYQLTYTVRYDSQIDTSMRVVDLAEERAYEIREIRNVSHSNRYLEINVDGNNWESVS